MIFGDLSKHGLPFPPLGVRRSVDERRIAPAVDAGFVQAVKDRRIELLPEIDRFEAADVVLADGARIQPDVVICATGYRRGLDSVVGHLGVLDEHGLPRGVAHHRGARSAGPLLRRLPVEGERPATPDALRGAANGPRGKAQDLAPLCGHAGSRS